MIHRKWSLLTGPAAILGGVVVAVVVANYIVLGVIISLPLPNFGKEVFFSFSFVRFCGSVVDRLPPDSPTSRFQLMSFMRVAMSDPVVGGGDWGKLD